MSKKLFLIGLNYYGTPYELSGCINDVENIEKRYVALGFTEIVRRIEKTGKEPTVKETLTDLKTFIKTSKSGDLLAFHYSGHGTWEVDKSKDEKDGRDEMICLLDGNVSDDTLNKIMVQNLPSGVKLRCLFDSCHSGTVMDLPYLYKDGAMGYQIENSKLNSTDVVMISGCRDSQTSADAWIEENRETEGAMTWSWLKTLEWMGQYHPNATWKDIVSKMRFVLLKGGYDQIPQISTTKLTNFTSTTEFVAKKA